MKDDVDVPGTDTSFLSAHQTSQIDHLLNGGQMTGQKLDVPLSPPQVASLAFTAKEATGDDFLNAHHGVVRPQACQRTGRRQILRQPPLPCRPRAAHATSRAAILTPRPKPPTAARHVRRRHQSEWPRAERSKRQCEHDSAPLRARARTS